MKTIAIIPARGGSKGIFKKNIKTFAGKPLITWTIELAKSIDFFDRIIISSDCKEIGKLSERNGAEFFIRPKELATDNSLVIDTVLNLIETLAKENYHPEAFALLEPTAPMRYAEDIVNCYNLLEKNNYDSVATFSNASINPWRIWKIKNQEVAPFIKGADPFLPRQKLPNAYQLNGYVYFSKINQSFIKSKSFLHGKAGSIIIPEERTYPDIDTPIEFNYLETIFKNEKLI